MLKLKDFQELEIKGHSVFGGKEIVCSPTENDHPTAGGWKTDELADTKYASAQEAIEDGCDSMSCRDMEFDCYYYD